MEDTKDETHQCNKRGLTTILFATGSNPQFCALLKTALLNEHNVHIVGWNLTHSRKGFVKFRGRERSIVQITPTVVATHVCTLCKEAFVLGADAFDTLFSAHSKPQNIVNSFSKFNSKFVWSAERYMWPKFTTLPPFVKKFYQKSKPNRSPYKYLNYGGWIGRAREACEILTLCSRQLARCTFCGCPNLKHCKKPQQDQGAAHVVFASRKGPYSELDKNQDIFHPAFPRCQNLKVAEDGRVQIQGLSTSTHMYHFNGNSKYKSGCSNYYKNGWFAGLEKPAGINDHITLIKNDNTKFVIPVAEICPYIWQEDFTWLEPKKYEKGGLDENISTLSIRSKVHDYLRVWKNEDY
jgi:hypothetical protein